MEYILRNIPAYERANEQLNQVSRKWQAEVEALNLEASTMYKNYQNEVVFLSQEQKKAKQDSIMQKEKEASDLKKKYFGAEGELYKKREALMGPKLGFFQGFAVGRLEDFVGEGNGVGATESDNSDSTAGWGCQGADTFFLILHLFVSFKAFALTGRQGCLLLTQGVALG